MIINPTTNIDFNPSSNVATLHIAPEYHINNGVWKRIDNTVASNKSVDDHVAEGLFSFRAAKRLVGSAPIKIGKGASLLHLTPLGTNNVQSVVSDNVVTYPNAYSNADLRYTVAGHFIKEEIVLRAGHPKQFSFRMDTTAGFNGMNGSDFSIDPPVLVYPNPPKQNEYYFNRPLEYSFSSVNNKTVLNIILPPGDWNGWVVDPTYSSQPSNEGKDTFIDSGFPSVTFESQTAMVVGHTFGDSKNPVETVRGLIAFDLSTIPSGSSVSSATLTLYHYGTNNGAATVTNLYRLRTDWFEVCNWYYRKMSPNYGWYEYGCSSTTADYENTVRATDSLQASTSASFSSLAINATSVQEMIPSGSWTNNGWLLKLNDESAQAIVQYYSSDHATSANRPKLEIVYTSGGGQSVVPVIMSSRRRMS